MSLTTLDYIRTATEYEQRTYTQLVLCQRDGPDGCEPDARRRWEEALRLVEAARAMIAHRGECEPCATDPAGEETTDGR